jgi:hypothetical protein
MKMFLATQMESRTNNKKIKEMLELKIKVHDKEKKCRLILA